MADMRIVRSDGEELYATGNFSTNGWTVAWQGLQDFLSLPLSISTSANVLTDGSTLVSKRVDECERTASIVYVGPRGRREVRDEALAFFNPKHSFEVHVTHMGVTRWCEGELAEVSCPIREDRRPCELTFTLLCLDPYMRSEDGNDYSLQDSRPMFGFPFVSHAKQPTSRGERFPVGFLASKTIYDGKNTLYNGGAVPCPYRVVIKGKVDIKNPKFTKDGKFVHYLGTVRAGEELIIAFDELPPKVYLDGKNVTMGCSRDSTFVDMWMDVGKNIVQFTMDNAEQMVNTDVRILYNKRYLGV